MTTLHATNTFNVENSINAALTSALAAISIPSWLTTPAIVYNWPDIEASTPCFSIFHFTDNQSDIFQGRGDGAGNIVVRDTGLMEISAWVNEKDYSSGQDVWAARLAIMGSM